MWGEERRESLSIEFQLVRVEGMTEIENHRLANVTIVAGKYQQMLKNSGQVYHRK